MVVCRHVFLKSEKVKLKLCSVRDYYAFEIDKKKAMIICSYEAVDIAAELMSKIRR